MEEVMEKWFRRLAEVPGIEYKPDPAIDRTKLSGHNAVPEVDRFVFDGKRHEDLSWPIEGGSTSASPAALWKSQPLRGETKAETTLRQIWERLEMPGTLSDYHFAIQGCPIYARRDFARQEPRLLEEVERLFWLDIRLINRYPGTITYGEEEERQTYFGVSAFHQLIEMYETEGYLREALEVAKIGQEFEQCLGKVEQLEERINRVEAEADAA